MDALRIRPKVAEAAVASVIILLGLLGTFFLRPDIVFVGDSITANWPKVSGATWDRRWINKGVAGDRSDQVRARFERDVLALHPRVVHILVGINDIGGPNGHLSLAQTEANIAAMASSASDSGAHVVIGTIEPIPNASWKSRPEGGGEPQIERLNAWIRDYGPTHGADVADYAAWMQPDMTSDGIHPTADGYSVMAGVAWEALSGAHHPPPPDYGTSLPWG